MVSGYVNVWDSNLNFANNYADISKSSCGSQDKVFFCVFNLRAGRIQDSQLRVTWITQVVNSDAPAARLFVELCRKTCFKCHTLQEEPMFSVSAWIHLFQLAGNITGLCWKT